MTVIEINGKEYRIPSGWEDITLDQCARVYSLKMPEGLRCVYDAHLKTPEKVEEAERQITITEQHKSIPRYFSEVVEALSDVPREVLKKTSVVAIKTLYHQYLQRFVEGIHFMPADYDYKPVASFDFEGERYFLPVDKTIFGQQVPMVDVTALEFTESADLMIHLTSLQQERDLLRIANMVSILCRPQGEQYDEAVSLARAEKFKRLTMDVCWNVFFSLITPLVIFAQSEQISFLEDLARGESTQTN